MESSTITITCELKLVLACWSGWNGPNHVWSGHVWYYRWHLWTTNLSQILEILLKEIEVIQFILLMVGAGKIIS